MDKTKKYHLPQWDKEDRIMMEDFNQMCRDIEEGIESAKTEAKAESAAIREDLGSIGHNLRVEIGSYVGDGKAESANPTSLTFQLTPLVVILQADVDGSRSALVLVRPTTSMPVVPGSSGLRLTVTWEDHSVRWWTNHADPYYQYNAKGTTYTYLILGY